VRVHMAAYKIILAIALAAWLPSLAFAMTPSQVYESVKDSVVVVKVYDQQGRQTGQGSGVMLPSGDIVTNYHVVKAGVRYMVGQGKKGVPATLKAGDPDKDLCLLKATGVMAKPARLGKTSELKVGDPVYAVGAPEGLELSLSEGIVSQLRGGGSHPIIQTAVAISQGSSGGGLFNAKGELVGITTFYLNEGQSLNFALPVEWIAEAAGEKIQGRPILEAPGAPAPGAKPKEGKKDHALAYEGSIGSPGPREKPTQGGDFNRFMERNKGSVVSLFVFLDKEQQLDFGRGLAKPDESNRISFTVMDDYSRTNSIDFTGCEYLIHLPSKKEDFHFEYIKGAGRLSGCFKIWDISGPHQGFLSINLRPVRCQN
jgi:S1-C subfamily serine protease